MMPSTRQIWDTLYIIALLDLGCCIVFDETRSRLTLRTTVHEL